MGAIRSSETLATAYKTTQRRNPEYQSLQKLSVRHVTSIETVECFIELSQRKRLRNVVICRFTARRSISRTCPGQEHIEPQAAAR